MHKSMTREIVGRINITSHRLLTITYLCGELFISNWRVVHNFPANNPWHSTITDTLFLGSIFPSVGVNDKHL